MPILGPRHDYAHPVEPDPAWSESYYFNAYDPGSDSGFFTRIGIRPNEGTMDVSFSAWLPGGELAEYRHVVDQHEMVGPPLVVGGVRYELVEALKAWRIVADVARRRAPAFRPEGELTPSTSRWTSVSTPSPPWSAPTVRGWAVRAAIRPPPRAAPPARGISSRPAGGPAP